MRIALIVELIDTWRGGAETSTWQFLGHLLARGIQVHLITRSSVAPRDGLAVHGVKTPQLLRTSRTRAFLRQATRIARDLDVDLIHAITPCVAANIYEPRSGTVIETIRRNVAMRPTPLRRTLKRVTSMLNRKQRLLLREERRLLRRPEPPHVIALSGYVARQLREHYGLGGDRVSLIFNGVDRPAQDGAVAKRAARIRQLYRADGAGPLVLCVANNFRLKGVARAIEAVARLKKAGNLDATLVVVGHENPLRYKRLAARQRVADRVLFAGHTRHVAAFYAAADALVHPTYYDPCSRVVLEALSVGLPCVTTRFNGAAEAIDEPARGYVIDSPDDVDALADRLQRIVKDGRRPLEPPNGDTGNAALTMERHTAEVVALYEKLLAARETS